MVTKASQTEQHEPGGDNKMDLLGMLMSWPEEEWVNQNVHGKELSKGLDMNKLRKGLTMSKGDIPGVCTPHASSSRCALEVVS